MASCFLYFTRRNVWMLNQVPQIAELDAQIKQTETVKSLQDGQEQIINTIKDDREKNQEAFDKGAEKFDDLYKKVEDMKEQISDGFKEMKETITDNEISKLNKVLDERDNQIKTQDKRAWEVIKIFLTAIISIIATVLLFKFGL